MWDIIRKTVLLPTSYRKLFLTERFTTFGIFLLQLSVAPYVLDRTAQWIELSPGDGIKTLVFLNDSKSGIKLIKLDSGSLNPLPNARFRIRQISGGSYNQEHLTNASGEIDLLFLDPGVYEITELSVPEPFLIDDGVRLVEILPGKPDAPLCS
jgi:hypothetical protein